MQLRNSCGILLAAVLVAGCSVYQGSAPPASSVAVPELAPIAPYLGSWLGAEPRDGGLSAPDLARFAAAVDEAPIVSLGESVHGAHEIHQLAHRIFAYLAATRDFRVYALEVDSAHAVLMNEYVQGRRDDLDAILATYHYSDIFYDRALRDLLFFLREHNRTAEKKLSVAGYDLKKPDLTFQLLADGLRPLDPVAARTAADLYSRIAKLGGFGVFPNTAGHSGISTLPLPAPTSSPRRLEIRLRARARGFTFGRAGVAVRPMGISYWLQENLEFEPDTFQTAGDAWQQGSARMDVPADATGLQLIVYHRGNGTVWLDGLELSLDGVPLEVPNWDAFEPYPLMYPASQAKDHRAEIETTGELAGVLRLECDDRVDDALAASRELRALVDATLEQHAGRLAAGEATSLRRYLRLIEQALEWRTLVQINRDVFLAENLSWLYREGFPGQKIVSLAHENHARRGPNRMGSYLAEEYGADYLTVNLVALSGSFRYDDGPPTHELQVLPVKDAEVWSLGRRLAPWNQGDFWLDIRAAQRDAKAAEWLATTEPTWPGRQPAMADAPEIAIFLRKVGPFELLSSSP